MGDLTQTIAFAVGIAGPLTLLVTWIVRQVFKVSGTAARVVVWIISAVIAFYAMFETKLIPALVWTGPENVVTSIAALASIITIIVAVATAVYKVLDASNWTTADNRTVTLSQPPPNKL
jgi:hypothetical protein